MRVKIFLGLLLFQSVFASLVSARTRENVISDAIVYSAYNWTPSQNNLLDVKVHIEGSTQAPMAGSDGIDDRAFRLIKQDDESMIWKSSTFYWPFVKNVPVDGEAYAFSQWHTTTTFKYDVDLSTEKWIAGRRGMGTPTVPESLPPSGYAGFTGTDCSGFVSNLVKLNKYTYTGGLKDIAVQISTDKIKAGDWFFRVPSPAHVVVVGDSNFSVDRINIIHAGSWRYEVSEYGMKTVSENAEYHIEDGKLFLRYKSNPGDTWDLEKIEHIAYSAFPQITWLKNGNITDTVRVRIESGAKISTGTIRFVIDEG